MNSKINYQVIEKKFSNKEFARSFLMNFYPENSESIKNLNPEVYNQNDKSYDGLVVRYIGRRIGTEYLIQISNVNDTIQVISYNEGELKYLMPFLFVESKF